MTRRGFTLIELIAATALASVLIVGLLKVTVSLSRVKAVIDHPSVAPPPEQHDWVRQFHIQLQRDLLEARTARLDGDTLVLEGPLANGHDQTRRHGPARVTYQRIRTDRTGLLVRDQLDLLDRSNKGVSRQLLMAQVQSFEWVIPQSASDADAAPTSSSRDNRWTGRQSQRITPQVAPATAKPTALRYRLTLQGQTNPIEREIELLN